MGLFKINIDNWDLVRTNVRCTKTTYNPILGLVFSNTSVIADLYVKTTKRGKLKYKWVDV